MFQKISKIEFFMFCLMIVACIVGWIGFLDRAAYELNIKSLEETLLFFASMKGLSAIIVAVKNLPYIGALLTPMSEFIDQMSSIALLAVMSLGLQKIILVALQSFIVNVILSLSVLMVILNKFTTILTEDWKKKLFKFTILLFFIRFAIPLMTLTITSIESNTLKIQQEVSMANMKNLQEQLFQIGQTAEEKRKDEIKKEGEIKLLENEISILEKDKKTLKNQIETISGGNEYSIENIKTLSLKKKLSDDEKQEIANKNQQIAEIKVKIKTLNEKKDDLDSYFNFNNVTVKIKIFAAKVETKATNTFDSTLNTIVLFLFRNIIFPILFLWCLSKLFNRAFDTKYNPTKNII